MNGKSEDRALDERRLEVLIHQGSGLRVQILMTVAVVAAIVWDAIPPALVLTWMVAAVAAREWRAKSLLGLLEQPGRDTGERIRHAVRWNLVLGCVNGSAALFMLMLDTTKDALLTMILVSWGAGGVLTGATIVPAFLAYGTCLFVPTAAMWLVQGTSMGLGVGVLILMFFSIQIRLARRYCDTFEQSFRIRQENLEMSQRLEQEHVALAAARDTAEAANQAKSRFLASASHDLRQPLQALALNASEMSRASESTPIEPLAKELSRSIDDLRGMLDGLLDISSLDAGSVEVRLRSIHLDALVEGIASNFRAAAQSRGLALRWACEQGIELTTDPDVLRRILSNLIDNALKFTSQGSIDISAKQHDGNVEISVVDTGIGVEPQQHQLIFEELVQLHNPERDRNKGYGLGLSIVRRLVQLIGARLTLTSTPGRGSSFTLHLRTSPTSTTNSAEGEVQPLAASLLNCVILVLEDDAIVRAAYARTLESAGCRVLATGSVAQAVHAVEMTPPSVALVDFRLGETIDGLDAINRLRATCPGLTALLCTADTSFSIQDRARVSGVRILRKPIDATTLLKEIRFARASQLV